MRCINRVVVAGNLGRDPEIGATRKGMLVAKFSVAVDTPRPGGMPRTVWFQCLALKDQAEFVKRSLNHGDPVYVEGSLEPYEYQPRGSTRKLEAFRILVERIRPLPRSQPPAFDFAGTEEKRVV
jgi:single-strand DNA-binding protein